MQYRIGSGHVIGLVLVVALLTATASQAQVRFQEIIASADGTIRNAAEVILDTEFLNAERGLTFEDRSVSEFSLVTFPEGNQIISARLRLYSLTNTVLGPAVFSLSAYEGDGVVTVDDYGRTDPIVGTLPVNTDVFGFTELDVTNTVRQFLADGADFAGFLLWPRTDVIRYAHASKASREFLAAKLVITSVDFDSDCFESSVSLCLQNDRFNVRATSRQNRSPTFQSRVVPLSNDTGYFNFGNPSNVELVAKVLNGCNTFGSYFFFAAGLTNLEVTFTVVDLEADQVESYGNALGVPFPPIQDTASFQTCP